MPVHSAPPLERRRLGLDLARIFASFSIVGFHNAPALTLLAAAPLLGGLAGYITRYGYLAVDIFFVLSGWLLTRQALAAFSHRRTSGRFVGQFWVRRWFRTLPSYWLVVAVIAVPLGINAVQSIKHMLFVQTIVLPNLYPVSWSLVAEEWFYLVLPLAILVLRSARSAALFACLWTSALLASVALRGAYVMNGTDWLYVLTLPQARMEGLLVGSLLAVVSHTRPVVFARIVRHRAVIALAGASVAVALLVNGDNDSWWFQVPGLLVFSVAIGALIPYLSGLPAPRWLPAAVLAGITFVSELTYPLYLLHPLIPRFEAFRALPVVYYGSGFLVLFSLAVALHLVVERPFLRLRDRILDPAQPMAGAAGYSTSIAPGPGREIGVTSTSSNHA